MRLVDYHDGRLGDLQDCIMQWRNVDTTGSSICHPGDVPHRIYNGARGRIPVGEIVKIYEVDGEIRGFILGQPYSNGFDIFVNPTGIEKAELKELAAIAYEQCRQQMNQIGLAEKPVNSDVNERDLMRHEVFAELGFDKGDNWLNDTRRDLKEPIPSPELPEGFSIRASSMDDYAQLAAVHSGAFNSNWDPKVYHDEVMSKPGYAPEREIVVVAPDGRFAAFCVTWLDTVNKVGLFEPVGTHSDFQRKGLSRAMMNHALCLMKDLGMEEAEVGHETDNPASSNLYASLGFKMHERVFGYSKA